MNDRIGHWRHLADCDALAGAPLGAALNEACDEIERLRGERDAAISHVRRLCDHRDQVARAVRSPGLTDAERLEEIRVAFAIVDGHRDISTEAGEGR